MIIKKLLSILLLLLLALQLYCEEPNRLADDFVKASLVVVEQGERLQSVLGHAFYRMQCEYYDLDICYSYESEDVAGKLLRFLFGSLKMGMFAIPTDEYLPLYVAEGRAIYQAELQLPPEIKLELWRALDDMVDEGVNIKYDYLERGCAISCVNVLKKALGDNTIEYAPWDDKFAQTRYEIAFDAMRKDWRWWVWRIVVDKKAAQKKCSNEQKLVVPHDLMQCWQKAKLNGKTLLSTPIRIDI